jgi:gluconate 2-dehydrogenase gamma chain
LAFNVSNIARGVFGPAAGSVTMIVVSLMGRRPSPARVALLDDLRVPRSRARSAPIGGAAAPGSPTGLPVWAERRIVMDAKARHPGTIKQPGAREETMKDQGLGRRDFLKGAVVGGAAAATATTTVTQPQSAQAQQAPPAAAAPGYEFLNLEEAAFVEALVDHMVPADELTPKGTDIGINVYIDRALAGGWGKGDRLYMQGPWKLGVPSQGYQLPLTPAQLYRAGVEATNAHCRNTYGKPFDGLTEQQREEVLIALSTGKLKFENGLPVQAFWTTLYQTVMQGMFSDPIHGGNRNKAGWWLIGFPGVVAVHRENVEKYRDKKFPATPLSIADMS